jgi:hypothetical protein
MQADQLSQGRTHFGARDDAIDEAMLKQIFGSLEIFWELFSEGLFDNPSSGKPDCCFRFRQDNVAQHGKTGDDPTGGGIGQDGNIELFGFAVASQSGGDFGHLHQAEHPFLHPCATGGTEDDYGHLVLSAMLDRPRQFFAHDRTHAAAHEAKIHHTQGDREAFDFAAAGGDRVGQAGFFLGLFNSIAVGFAIVKLQGVGGPNVFVQSLPGTAIDQLADAFFTGNPLVVAAFQADHLVGAQVFGIGDRSTGVAFSPESVRNLPLLLGLNGWIGFLTVGKPVDESHRLLSGGVALILVMQISILLPNCFRSRNIAT